MNGGQIFILLIVLIAIVGGIIRRYLHLKATMPAPDTHTAERIQALEARVATLERIVTDKQDDLKRRFDQL